MWNRVLAYQIIGDQTAKVSFNLLSTWIRVLLSLTNCMNGSSAHSPPQIPETRTSRVKIDRSRR